MKQDLKIHTPCFSCQGTGKVQTKECSACQGKGTTLTPEGKQLVAFLKNSIRMSEH